MAIAITRPPEGDYVTGNKRRHTRDLALTGNYPTGGETISPREVGLSVIQEVVLHGVVAETDLTGAWLPRVAYQANGDVKIALFEAAAAGDVFTQKPAEAYESASSVRATFIGH